jgi:hypothetical protein
MRDYSVDRGDSYPYSQASQSWLSARFGFRAAILLTDQNQAFGFPPNWNPLALKMEFFCLFLTFPFLP